MNIEEKLAAIKVINTSKEYVEKSIEMLEAFEPHKLDVLAIPCKGGASHRHDVLIDEETSRQVWHCLHTFLENEKVKLMEKAKELMK